MIDLYVSTSVSSNAFEIATLMGAQKLECQIYTNVSSVVTKDSTFVEQGYHIRFFNLKDTDFKTKVWEILQPKLDLTCAYVKVDNRYMGCIYNWPRIFTESKCRCSINDSDDNV